MELLDALVLVVVAGSVFAFLRSPEVEKRDLGPIGLRVYEGEMLPGGGRNGTVELEYKSLEEEDMDCRVRVQVLQFRFVERYSSEHNVTFPPGHSFTNLTISLPNGKNHVVADVEC